MHSILPAAFLGFLLGLKHATDADHVVAVTTFVAREPGFRRAAWIGGLWGVGHSLTVFMVGGALVAFRVMIPARVALGLEFGVALMLILLGFNALRPTAGGTHAPHEHPVALGGWRPLVVGVVHGLAGSAAVAILVLAAIPETAWALVYLGVFGVGTVAGMMVVTWLIAAPAVYAARRMQRFQRGIRLAAGAISVAVGLLLAREIIVRGGLFAAAPVWSPR